MGIDTSELRLEYTRHELYILSYAEKGMPIEADPATVSTLVKEGLIRRTPNESRNVLTDHGHLACHVVRKRLPD